MKIRNLLRKSISKQFQYRLMSALLMLITSQLIFAQTKSITGKVVDEKGETVIGAAITVKGTSRGTTTNIDGGFSIAVGPKEVLSVRLIGYVEQEITPGSQTILKVVMKEDTQVLDEVVVVGYGVQKKSDVTGAMARVGEKELKAMPVKDALQGMQGKVAGIDITTNQRPGQVGDIKIRGVRSINAENNPLYVVDGMVLQASGIDNINPSDIESIDVLKDASATAIYGSRGANGVILVTTKRGKSGKLSVNYSGSVTFEKMYNVTENMNAGEWIDYSRLAKINAGTYGATTASRAGDFAKWSSIADSWANIDAGWSKDASGKDVWNSANVKGYDWEQYGKHVGVSTEHTLSVSGGSQNSQAYGSFGYFKQEGTQPGQKYERYTSKVSFDATPTKWFKMGTAINGSFANQDYGYSFAKSVTGAGDYYGALRGMLAWTVPYDANGAYIRNPAAGDVNIINPIDELDYTVNNRKGFIVNSSFYSQLDFGEMFSPLKGLKYRIQFGPELRYNRNSTFYDKAGINGDGSNQATYNTSQILSWTLDNLIYYDRNLGSSHKIGVTLMQSASGYHSESSNMKSNTLATTNELWYNIGSGGSLNGFGTGLSEKQMASYMARINYGYKEKYLLTASARLDGSSVLADGHKWAPFYSAALGWRIDQEKFMKNVTFIDALKLRLGAGVTGNAAIGAYGTKGGITQMYYNWGATASTAGYIFSDLSASSPVLLANSNLGWEKTTQYNLGLDYTLLKSRISGSMDIYKTQTKDLLMRMSIPSATGYVQTWSNVGETKGWGIDFQVNSLNIKTKDFAWSTTLTWSLDRCKVEKLSNGRTQDIGSSLFVGKELGVYYDFVYDGIWKTSEATEAAKYGRKPGQIRVKDLNIDNVISSNDDRQIVGKTRPDWSGGISNTFNYKNLELSFFIYSRWGFTVNKGSVNLGGLYQTRKVDYWIAGINEDAEYYSPGSNGVNADVYAGAQSYQDGSFVKMRNINLGYNFSSKQLSKLKISNLKIYAQVMNPFTIYSKCKILDTDLSSYDNNTTSTGTDITTKAIVFGINVGF